MWGLFARIGLLAQLTSKNANETQWEKTNRHMVLNSVVDNKQDALGSMKEITVNGSGDRIPARVNLTGMMGFPACQPAFLGAPTSVTKLSDFRHYALILLDTLRHFICTMRQRQTELAACTGSVTRR